jgi:hypothetical protein
MRGDLAFALTQNVCSGCVQGAAQLGQFQVGFVQLHGLRRDQGTQFGVAVREVPAFSVVESPFRAGQGADVFDQQQQVLCVGSNSKWA